jgi:fatty acid desaturase
MTLKTAWQTGRVFRYREDRLPTLLFVTLFVLDVLVYFTVDHPALLVGWYLLTAVPKGCICAWNHHHQHLPFFEVPILNRAMEVVFGHHTGVTGHAWVLHHSLGHHVNYLDQTKDESRWMRKDGTVMGPIAYMMEVGLTAYPRAFVVGAKYPKKRRVFVAMFLISVGIAAAAVAYRPLPGFIIFVVAPIISLFGTAWATHDHHSGKVTKDPMLATNNILNRAYNIATGNLGYHTAHHVSPGVHWSRLPALHDTMKAQIPASCYVIPGMPWSLFVDERPVLPSMTSDAPGFDASLST